MFDAILAQLTPGWEMLLKAALVLVPGHFACLCAFGAWCVRELGSHDKRLAVLETYKTLMPSANELSRKSDVDSAMARFEARLDLSDERVLHRIDELGRKVDTLSNDVAHLQGALANGAEG